MELGAPLIDGKFITRLNRFAAMVAVAGQEVMVHVANSGRMRELLVPGQRVLVRPVAGEHRKCRFDLALVDLGFTLASADARLPNALVAEALTEGRLPQFADFPEIRREVTFGESRLDLMLTGTGGCCYIETKSVTLVVEGTALFPDSPTSRGAKHLRTLIQVVEAGHRAAAIFVIQRQDARDFAIYDTADPEFAAGLRAARAAGVEAYAYSCQVTEERITLSDPLPFR